MTELEKILQEIEYHAIEFEAFGFCDDYISVGWVKDIIKTHLSSNEGQNKCGECSRRKFYQMGYEDGNKDNDVWIPCSERLPDKGEKVLCYFKYEPESPDVMCDNVYICSGIWQSETDKVVAWMKRPVEYKHPVESEDSKRMMEREEFFEDGEQI